MPLYDITKALRGGDALPFSDDCVLTCRTGPGDIILKFDTGISRAEAAEILAQAAAGLGRPLSGTETGAAESRNLSARASCPEPEHARSAGRGSADPASVTEDLVRFGSCTVYRIAGGDWWWVKWRADTGEMWGLSGPLMGAAEMRRGPFQTYDETLADMMYCRAASGERNFQG